MTLSIDGPQRFHDSARRTRSGKGSHEKVVHAANRLKAADVPFDCIAVVTDAQLDYPDEFCDFFSELRPGLLGINLDELDGVNARSSLLTAGSRDPLREERYRTFIRRVVERTIRDRSFQLRELRNVLSLIKEPAAVEPPRTGQQTTPWRIVAVDWAGNLQTYSPELLGLDIPSVGRSIGNVHRDTVASISRGAPFQSLRRAIARGVRACREGCGYFSVCGGGAPSNKLSEHGRLTASETSFCRHTIQINFDECINALLAYTRASVHSPNAQEAV